jgi:rhodanese-related sulfurtransferase
MRQLEAKELDSWLSTDRASVTLLDVREPWEAALCAIEGSKHIPLNELPGRVAELEPGRPTVLICHHGMRSQVAGAYLAKCGFTDLANLRGGIDAWARTVDPAMAVY